MRMRFSNRITLSYCLLTTFYFVCHVVTQPNTDPFTQSGNYLIYGCGSSTYTVKALLEGVHKHLQSAIESIESAGPSGTETYNAFFRGVDPKIVTGVFRRIITGPNVKFDGQEERPSIACPRPNVPMLREHWKLCDKAGRFGYHDTSQYVFLCPRTLALQAYPHARDCVRSTTNPMATGRGLIETKLGVLVHELVHMYLGRPDLKPEVYDIFRCLELPPTESVANAGSYTFYIANFVAGCKQFRPPEAVRKPSEQEL